MNIKIFWAKNKTKILVIGGGVAAAAVAFLVTKKFGPGFDRTLRWDNSGDTMDLERVKRILEANKDNDAAYAIFREAKPNEYVAVVLDKKFIDPD